MKFNHVIASVGLTLAMGFSAVAGLLTNKEAKEIKADSPNTWMFRAQLDLGVCSPSNPDSVFGDDEVVGVRFHVWGTNVDTSFEAKHMYSASDKDFYAATVSLKDDQVIEGAQWVLTQKESGDKYSVDITEFGDDEAASIDKDTDIAVIQYLYKHTWTEGKWGFSNNFGDSSTYMKVQVDNASPKDYLFVKEPENNRFAIYNLEVDPAEGITKIGFDAGGITFGENMYDMLDEKSKQYTSGDQPNWWYSDTGTFDFFLYEDTLSIRRYEEYNGWIYFVSQSDIDDSDLYIYTYGGTEPFGAWPGTKVNEQYLPGLAEVDLCNGLHFQGQEHKVFFIPVLMGYSTADHVIFHNNSGDETKSIEFELVSGAAYWHYGTSPNEEAGSVLYILTHLQIKLQTSGLYDYGGIDLNNSVCAISSEDATMLYNLYDQLDDGVKTAYIDSSWVNTYTGNGDELGWRCLTEVFVELGKKAGLIPSSSSYLNSLIDNSAISTTIICIASSTTLALVLLLVFKRKRK